MSRAIRSKRIERWGAARMTNYPNCPTQRLKFLATLNDAALTEDTDPEFEVLYIDIGNVDSSGCVHDVAPYRFEAAPSRARRLVKDGDVIISTVRTYLEAIAPITAPPENLVVSTGFAVVRPKTDKLDPGFCKYALRERRFMYEVVARSTGISYPAINASDLADIELPVPPINVQRRIAAFLDAETQRLDALVIAKQRLLDLLAEKRRVLVAHAVTQGLNSDVSLQDSGIPWLGKIPAHWRVFRAKVLFREIDERSDTGEEVLLSLRMTKGLVPHNDVSEKVITPEDLIGYKKAWPQQIVINRMRAASGLIAVVPQTGLVSPDYAVFESVGEVNPEFFTYLFKTPLLQAVFRSESKGLGTGQSGFLRLYSENFLSLHMPVPPIEEQHAILQRVHIETKKIDDLAEATERTVTLLQERRSALISAAVTGTLKVGNAN